MHFGFRGEEKTGVPREKPLGAEQRTNNRTRATLVGGECSDTAPTLLPKIIIKTMSDNQNQL